MAEILLYSGEKIEVTADIPAILSLLKQNYLDRILKGKIMINITTRMFKFFLTVYLYIKEKIMTLKAPFPSNNPKVNLINYGLTNESFNSWDAGGQPWPWCVSGDLLNEPVRESTIVHSGTYSCGVRPIENWKASNCYVHLRLDGREKDIEWWIGKTITFSIWAYFTVAGRVRADIYLNQSGGGVQASSEYHSGNSTWEQLTVSWTVPEGTTGEIRLRGNLATPNGGAMLTAYFDDASGSVQGG
jgi:hypothetical protein